MSIVLVGCSETSNSGLRTTGQAQELSGLQAAVLGFEDAPDHFSTNNGTTVNDSAVFSEGEGALSITFNGYTELGSVPIQAPGEALGAALLDVRLENTVSWGQLRLVLKAPSQGVHWMDLGEVSLAGLPAGDFHTKSFQLSPSAAQVLESSAADVSFLFTLNAPSGTTLLLDNLRVAKSQVGTNGSEPQIEMLTVFVPNGTAPEEILLSGQVGIVIDARCTTGTEGENAKLAGLGTTGIITTQAGSTIHGDVISAGPVSLASQTTVYGNVTATGAIEKQDPVVITGTQKQLWAVQKETISYQVIWPGEVGSNLVVPADTPNLELSTGAHGKVEVFLVIDDGAELIVAPDAGWVQVNVAETLQLSGTTSGLGRDAPEILFVYGGAAPARVAGTFGGALVAPTAEVVVQGGPHAAMIYGHAVSITDGAQLTGIDFPWGILVEPSDTPDVVVGQDPELPGSLLATNAAPTTVSKGGDGFQFVVPGRIPVNKGNAGNGTASIDYTRPDGSQVSCTYQGGAPVEHPISLLDVAKRREYHLQQCSDGTSAGTVEEVTEVSASLAGDPQVGGGTTAINLPIDNGCEGDLVEPMALAESRELIEAFQWPDRPAGFVPEDVNGLPSLYYAAIYITQKEDLEKLDRLLIHWEKAQIFPQEWPEEWDNVCGTLYYDHDGEGKWVYAVLPGSMYNALLRALDEDTIHPDEREVFRAIRLLNPPDYLATSESSFDVQELGRSGFEYRGLTGVPDAVALQDAQFGMGPPTAFLADVLKWVWDSGKSAFQTLAGAMGVFDFVYGVVKVRLDVDTLLNQDATFPTGSVMTRAWGPNNGNELAAKGAKVNFWTTAIRPLTNPIPFSRLSSNFMSSSGKATFLVGKGCDACGEVDFKRTCVELENRAAYVSTWLIAASVCSRDFSETKDFDDFKQNSDPKWEVSNLKLRHLTEFTDSHQYIKEVVGTRAKQAKVMIGPNAYTLNGYEEGAVALCLGFGDLLPDVVFENLRLVLPTASTVAAGFLSVVGNTDIAITDDNPSARTRGLATHEYGHYALCDLTRKEEAFVPLEDLVLSFDTIAAGSGNPDPDEEARVVNEAFADFFAMQIAGGANYDFLRGRDGIVDRTGFNFSVGHPTMVVSGTDLNLFDESAEDGGIGRLATMMQDVFDGRPFRNAGPTSGESWIETAPGSKMVTHRALSSVDCLTNPGDVACRSGDTDLEQVKAGGEQIREVIRRFMEARNDLGAYRKAPMEEGIVKTALHHSDWCQACLLAAPHLRSSAPAIDPATGLPFPRDLLASCLGGRLQELLGPAPDGEAGPIGRALHFDASCQPCDPGFVMARDGTCQPCPTDQTIPWDGDDCEEQTVSLANAALDACPDSFDIEVIPAPCAAALTGLNVAPAANLVDEVACSAAHLTGRVEATLSGIGATQLLSFDVNGQPCTSDGFSDLCLNNCRFSGTGTTFPVAPQSVRLRVNALDGGVDLLLRNESATCDPIIR